MILTSCLLNEFHVSLYRMKSQKLVAAHVLSDSFYVSRFFLGTVSAQSEIVSECNFKKKNKVIIY